MHLMHLDNNTKKKEMKSDMAILQHSGNGI